MKKTLAFLLCLAMLFTALSVNVFAADPTAKVTVVANSPDSSNNVTFAVKLSGFASLKGIDLKITGTGITFGDTVTATNVDTALTKDTNYTVSTNKDEIHIVELTSVATDPVIISGSATLSADVTKPKITVTACKLAKSGEALYVESTDYTFNNNVSVAPSDNLTKPAETTVENDTTLNQPTDDYFIPMGCVVDASGNVIKKDTDGSFSVSTGAKYYKFPKPANGIMTYGISDSTVQKNPAKQFGNYVNNYDKNNKYYGSLIIVGDWDKFVQKCQAKTGLFLSEILVKLYADYETKKTDDKDYVKFTLNKNTTDEVSINVYKVVQNNYMWKDESNNILEYAVRVYGLVGYAKYTAVAYNVAKDGSSNPDFSAVIKSEKYIATN